MLQKAYKLLREQYEECLRIVADDEYCTQFAREKWRHSMQVAGAGNYLIRHIDWLKNQPEKFIDMVKTAVLLHDVCRFTEIVHLYNGDEGYDHSVAGGELLKNMLPYVDIRVWLPIKHHGHMIEDLYADIEYQKIADEEQRKEVEKICFIIRDADKIANMHMLANENKVRFLFLGPERENDGNVSEEAKKAALSQTVVGRKYRVNRASSVVTYLSWYADINYKASIDFCDRLKVTDELLQLFATYCTDKEFVEQYTKTIRTMLKEKAFLL